jgi:ribosomal 50S subunit-associated protein YjgA (DUF615 family)
LKELLERIQQLRDELVEKDAFINMIKKIVKDHPNDAECGEVVKIIMKSYLDKK